MTKKDEVINSFDPNGPGKSGNIYGLPFDKESSDLVLLPVPWEVTVSYNAGTAEGPAAILEASAQVDLYHKEIIDPWKMGICMLPIDQKLQHENDKYRDLAAKYIDWLESNDEDWISDELKVIPKAVDQIAEKLNIFIKSEAVKLHEQGKMVGLVGGDHSTPLGLIKAMGQIHNSFGILQIDAHADLRESYENFTYSHASIMYNALQSPSVSKLVQLGVRDICDEEIDYIKASKGRVISYYDRDIKTQQYEGKTWSQQCDEIIDQLPELVYLSVDIDGLDPKLCPNTGTPVPGGLEYTELVYLIKNLVLAGKKIIAFDLNEVAPGNDEWDANVGARLLYELCSWMAVSQGKAKLRP